MKYTKFKAIVLLLIVGLFTVPAFAACDNINVPGLSDAEEAKLKLSCQQALVAAATAPDIVGGLTDPNKLSAYGIVAQEWAKALGLAATELGIAVDTFLDTDAGKLTAFIIIWQVMGETILGFLLGVPLLIVIMWIGIRTAHRAKISGIEYSETKTTWRGKPAIKEITYYDEDQTVMYWLAHIVTIFLSIMTISWVIF